MDHIPANTVHTGIPQATTIIDAGRAVLADALTWREGKTYGGVRTFSKKIPSGPPWFMRVSRHGPEDGNWNEFWTTLGNNHAVNEAECVHLFRAVIREPNETLSLRSGTYLKSAKPPSYKP